MTRGEASLISDFALQVKLHGFAKYARELSDEEIYEDGKFTPSYKQALEWMTQQLKERIKEDAIN